MNAVISANTLKWRESSAFNSAFQMECLDVQSVMTFNAKAAYDADFKAEFKADVAGTLQKCGFSELDAVALDDGWEERLHLTDEEFEAADELITKLSGKGIKANMAIEHATSSQGVGVPAIALLILVVAVFVFLFSTHKPTPQ